MEWNGCFYSFNYIFTQSSAHGIYSFFPCLCNCYEFADHAIIIRRDHIACIYMAVYTNTMPAWRTSMAKVAVPVHLPTMSTRGMALPR